MKEEQLLKMVKYVILKTGKREGSLTAPLFILCAFGV